MRWAPDAKGRFARRPFYSTDELEGMFARLVEGFWQDKYAGPFEPPWQTEDLATLIEQHADSLDLYADLLSREGDGVQGCTTFIPNERPAVEIDRSLSSGDSGDNRLRTTLTHECAHVVLHQSLWQDHFALRAQPSFLPPAEQRERTACHRDTITGASQSDWLEWQAGYGCGAILMPARHVIRLVHELRAGGLIGGTLLRDSADESVAVGHVSRYFVVSQAAARVRLRVLDISRVSTRQRELG